MNERRSSAKTRDALRAAQLYYQQNLTMEAIAEDLNVSRSSVSRLLTHARASGLVEIRIHSPQEARSRIEQRFSERFGITAHIVPSSERQNEVERLERTAQAAARLVASAVTPRTTIGVAWGSTTSAVARQLQRKPVPDTRVVQMNGAANGRTTGVSYATGLLGGFGGAFSSEIYEFPVPAIFDDPNTRVAMWRERAVSRVVDLQATVNLFIFSLGSRIGDQRSHIYSGGYLGSEDLRDLAEHHVVGDCATVFFRSDGSTDDIPMNDRSSGPPFEVVRRIPQRLCVVSGTAKRDSLRGALAAGIITELVVDEALARSVLAADRDSS